MTKSIAARDQSSHRVVSAALSMIALVGMVVVAPIGLLLVSGPLHHLDITGLVKQVSAHRINGSRLVVSSMLKGALLLAWIAWAWLTICVIREIRSRVTGRRRVGGVRRHSVESLVAVLVGSALTISAMGRVTALPGMGAPRPPATTEARPTSDGVGLAVTSSIVPLRVIDDSIPTGRLNRSKGVDISTAGADETEIDRSHGRETVLGGGLAGSVSNGRTDGAQADGVAPVTVSPEVADSRSARSTHLVLPRETLWSVARERLGSPLRWQEIADLNYGMKQADGSTLTAEHWIRPGWQLELPSPPNERDLSEVTRHAGIRTSHRDPGNPEVPVPRVPTSPLGGGIVGAGVANLLDRMRRVQQRHRTEGAYIRLPDNDHRSFEQRLRIGTGQEVVHTVDRVLRGLVTAWNQQTQHPPLINGIKVQPETIELVVDRLDQSEWLPAPFRAAADGCSILIERSALQVLEVSQESASPMPLLVTAGHGLEGLVMVNIEALGTLVVDGDPGDTEGVVRAIGLELATSFWMDRFDLSVVGFGAELERFDRVVSVVDVPDFLDGLYRRRLRNEVLLRESGFSSFGQARYKDESDRWDPIVVVCGPTVTKDAVVEFRQLASDPRLGISVVAVGDASDGQHVMRLSGSDSSLSPKLLGSVIFPQQVGPEDLNAVNSLLNTATSHESALRSEEPYVNLPVLMSTPTEDSGQGVLLKALSVEPEALTNGIQETEVEIAVLGQIEIRGAAREFTRAWAEELVVYLAMHPNGATNEAWATALWPDRLMAPSSLHSTASVARRALGEARNGRDHLPRSHSRLALSDTVSTDWSKFVLHADSDSPRRWRAALELVRGRPFEGLRSTDWPILEGIGPAIEAAVVDLSGRFSGWSLSQGDAQSAEWAARKGLLVSPYDERLYRMLMRAADLSGNPAGVESVMSELIKLVAEDVEPLESVHPSTMQLYRSLSRRRDAIPRSR